MPVVAAAGIDLIHFGLVVTVNLAIGLFLPPFGLNLFASHALFGTPLPELYRGVVPFLLIYLAVLVLAHLRAGDHASTLAVVRVEPMTSPGAPSFEIARRGLSARVEQFTCSIRRKAARANSLLSTSCVRYERTRLTLMPPARPVG